MDRQLHDIAPREMTDIKELQDGLVLVINLFERQLTVNEELRAEIRSLKDENQRLKGEHANPRFPKPPKGKQPQPNTGQPKPQKGKGKNHKTGSSKKGVVKFHRTVEVTPDPGILPADAVFKGYKNLVQQDIRFEAFNTRYRVAIYHSVSEGKTYRGEMPADYKGQFGSGITMLTQVLHHVGDMTQGRLEAVYESLGLLISAGTISNIITDKGDWALAEQNDILRNGIKHSKYAQADGTKSVQKGKSLVTQVIGSDKFRVFLTLPGKSRLDILNAIQGRPVGGLRVCWNAKSEALLNSMKVAVCHQAVVRRIMLDKGNIKLSVLEQLLDESPLAGRSGIRRGVLHALALSYYLEQEDFPVIQWLLSDDAGEYTKISGQGHGLCWIHDVRYYRKLIPRLDVHKKIHDEILDQYWSYYARLNAYREADKKLQEQQKPLLEQEFEVIFNRTTDYFQINDCLQRTYANKEKLLAVLKNPAIPLHNNAAERGARRVVRKRDISLHTWSDKGTRIRDAYMTISQTAAILGVNVMDYIKDRISGQYQMMSLAERIAM